MPPYHGQKEGKISRNGTGYFQRGTRGDEQQKTSHHGICERPGAFIVLKPGLETVR